MSVEHARSGDLVDLHPPKADTPLAGSVALVRDDWIEVMRWVLPAGRQVPEHLAYGPVTVQCVEGEAILRLADGDRMLRPGSLAYLAAAERHSFEALTDTVLLVTMALVPGPATAGVPVPMHGERTGPGLDIK
ncbi:MAG TPA: cupin domain-containing protein [Burkholderiaceae bacterium]|nr:cupin domain-containing protein [Burkholderiaceae bacterium]